MARLARLRSRRFVLLSVIVIVAIAATLSLILRQKGGNKTVVQTEVAARGEVVELVAATGRVQPQSEVKISANVSGLIDRVEVKEGDRVREGQVLVEIDPTRYAAIVLEAEAGLRSARAESRLASANLEQSQREHSRKLEMHAKGLLSDGDLESAETALTVAGARRDAAEEAVNRAEAFLAQARDERSKTTILAPKDGIVTRLGVEVGEVVLGTAQNVGTTLMTVADLNQMEVLAQIDESEVVKVSPGDSARITLDALPGRLYSGLVSEIANSATTRGQGTAEEATHFEVKVALLGDVAALRPGMSATLDIVTERRQGVLNLPIQCVTLRALEEGDDGAPAADRAGASDAQAGTRERDAVPGAARGASNLRDVVYVVRDGVAHEVAVETGISSPTHIEILKGEIAAGDEVVSGSYRVLARELGDLDRVKVDNESLRRGSGPDTRAGSDSRREEPRENGGS